MVDIPAGEHAVLVRLPGGELVYPPVGSEELPVDVAHDIRLQEILVKQAVELLSLGETAAGNGDLAEQRVPGVLRGRPDTGQVRGADLGLPVERGVLPAHVRDADLSLDDLVLCGVESKEDRVRVVLAFYVDDLRLERLAERDVEVDRVLLRTDLAGLVAEAAAGLVTGELSIADCNGVRSDRALLAVPQLDQQVSRGGLREDELADGGVLGRGQACGNGLRHVTAGRVVASLRDLAVVA